MSYFVTVTLVKPGRIRGRVQRVPDLGAARALVAQHLRGGTGKAVRTRLLTPGAEAYTNSCGAHGGIEIPAVIAD